MTGAFSVSTENATHEVCGWRNFVTVRVSGSGILPLHSAILPGGSASDG